MIMRFMLLSLCFALLARAALAQKTVPKLADSYEERMPVFPGGQPGERQQANSQRLMKFLNDSLRFPPRALRDGVQGKVFVAFTVDSTGRTRHIKLVQGLRSDVDEATLRSFRRLEQVQWRPGTQNSRPVAVSFTVPISFRVAVGGSFVPTDSLDLPPFRQPRPGMLTDWDLPRRGIPADKAVIYGLGLQRLGFESGGFPQTVRVVNLHTNQAFHLNVKPAFKSRRDNPFCYALPPGRYALSYYDYTISKWYGGEPHREQLCKRPTSSSDMAALAATRYLFTIGAGKTHYVGTWDLTTENEPRFHDEKAQLDTRLRSGARLPNLAEAVVAIPR